MVTAVEHKPMTREQRKVIFASSLGTVFEWYDFYLYGSLAAIIAKQFFSGLDSGSAFIFALLAFGQVFGFVGVLIALQPRGEDLQAGFVTAGGLAVLGAAACYAVAAVVGRLSSRTDSTESMVLWMMVIVAVGAGAMAWPNWVPVQLNDWPLLLTLGITGFCGQLAITVAFRHGQASAVAPFEYTALAWGVGLDWLIWQTLPQSHTWLGAAIIVGSGLFLVRREKRITQAHATAEHP